MQHAVTPPACHRQPPCSCWPALHSSPVAASLPTGGPPHYPPPEVTTAQVEQKDVPIYGEWVANLDGYTNAQIQPQVTGYLIRQDYKEGLAGAQGADPV